MSTSKALPATHTEVVYRGEKFVPGNHLSPQFSSRIGNLEDMKGYETE